MDQEINYRLIAAQMGNAFKYSTTVNEVDRVGQSTLRVSKESFPNESITSVRAKSIYDWVLTLAKMPMDSTERAKRLISFCLELSTEEDKRTVIGILERSGCPYNLVHKDSLDEFLKRNFHAQVIKHSQKLFIQGNYFHSVFEAAKAYNKDAKEKSLSEKDGQPLMLSVWGADSGVLKVTRCETQTDKDYQDGIKFISGGIMSAIRNPTAHEPAIEWPIGKQDCMDILSLISFLYRQLDKATYFKA